MALTARYHDGHISEVRDVTCTLDPTVAKPELVIADAASGEVLDRWPSLDVHPLHSRDDELRIGVTGRPYGARLAFSGRADADAAKKLLPAIGQRHKLERGKQLRTVGIATAALASVIVAYIFGVPLLAGRIATLVPPEWEERLGDAAQVQIEALLRDQGGFTICDTDPGSVANRAIARFAREVVEGSGTPFTPNIQVARTSVPNAFALPGGRSYYFSALLDQTETADEFAGVMAHELGHVVHRHGMENLIATSATGLLIGFILGDMTGLSIAGGIGASLIDSRFSREAEREADRFAAEAGRRLGFGAAGLAILLERVAGDDDMTKLMALLSTHPLTSERRTALEALAASEPPTRRVFSETEWLAIKAMCSP